LKRALGLISLLGLVGCMPRVEAPKPVPHFDPLEFFAGESEGQATLKTLFSKRVAVSVKSHGRMEGDMLVLGQTIVEGEKRPRDRSWRIHRVGPDRYAGSLTDAVGPVSGDVEGNRLHLAFPMKGGFDADQWLSLAPDGRSAHNILVVRKFGLVIAVVDEIIRRKG